MGPASVSLPDPFPRGPRVTPSLLQNTSRTRVSSGRAMSPAPPHTAWHPQRLAPLPGCRLPPWDLLGSWVQRAQPPLASRGKERHPCPSGRWGDRAGRRPPLPHQQPLPREPPAPAWLCLTAPGRPWAAPAQGSVGSCYSVPNPTGHRAIYLDVGPAPPLTSPTLSTSGKAALYAHLPPLYLPQGFSAASWVPRDR